MFFDRFLLLLRALFCLIAVFLFIPVFAQDKSWQKQYQEVKEYDGVYVVRQIQVACKQYQSFLVDASGRKLSPPYRDIGDFSEGLAEFVPFERNGESHNLHGFMDRSGKVVIPALYVGTDKFYKGKTWVIYRKGKQFGLSYIDRTGQLLFDVPVEKFKDDFLISKAKVQYLCGKDAKEDIIWWKDDNLFLLNWNFSPFIEKEILESKRIFHFNYKGKYGIIDKSLILRVPMALDGIDPEYKFSGQGLERVKYGDKYGYIDQFTGVLVTAFDYTDTRKPTNGMFWVQKDKKWGCIDRKGNVRIPFDYDDASGFTREDRAAVAKNGKFGHIDKKGRVRTPLTYDFASYFNNGLSMVRVGDKYGFIDTTNTLKVPLQYDEAMPFDKPTTLVERNGKRYELNLKGEETFLGFTTGWNAIFIFVAFLGIITVSNAFFRRRQRSSPLKKR